MHDFDENGEQPEWDTAMVTGFGGTYDEMLEGIEPEPGDPYALRNNHWHPTR